MVLQQDNAIPACTISELNIIPLFCSGLEDRSCVTALARLNPVGHWVNAYNRMTQAVDSAGGTITEAYDNLDRLTSETTPQGQISHGYDLAGRRARDPADVLIQCRRI